ncbi:MAG: hypothetical protein RBS99_17220 [Rhodospirillales bacterium]|nr:hypothetical protein [Rhodospirillales bacterium]
MSDIKSAIDDLFADANLAHDAFWHAGGADDGVPVRAILRRPDRNLDLGALAVYTPTAVFEVRVTEMPTPAAGDTMTLDGETFVVQGEPIRDSERLLWTIDTRPA